MILKPHTPPHHTPWGSLLTQVEYRVGSRFAASRPGSRGVSTRPRAARRRAEDRLSRREPVGSETDAYAIRDLCTYRRRYGSGGAWISPLSGARRGRPSRRAWSPTKRIGVQLPQNDASAPPVHT